MLWIISWAWRHDGFGNERPVFIGPHNFLFLMLHMTPSGRVAKNRGMATDSFAEAEQLGLRPDTRFVDTALWCNRNHTYVI
jgi:hypothetical protein